MAIELDIKYKLPDFVKISDRVREGLITGMKLGMAVAEARAKTRMGQPGELGIRTGTLRRSIMNQVIEDGDMIIGSLYSNVRYAKVHEEGAIIPAHLIRARRARALSFIWEGRRVFFKSVWAKPRYQQPHPYLRPSIEDNLGRIRELVIRSITSEVEHGQ